MKLSESEKQDIFRYLDAGKPLPEKYRFLLFEDKREVELVWNGKSNEVTNVVLPFQVIEQVDEPRSEKEMKLQTELFDFSGRQVKGWTNKLIWGDNKLILSSLKNGPLRDEIEAQGGIKLIYIDPPFDVGADFSMDIEIGDETLTKRPNVLEELAYRDTWGRGADSFIAMIHERLMVMRDLLANDGSIYIHCDWRLNSILRLVCDEVMGSENYCNEIVWKRGHTVKSTSKSQFPRNHDSILFYSKSSGSNVFNPLYGEYSQGTLSNYNKDDKDGRGLYRLQSLRTYSQKSITEFRKKGLIYETESGKLWLKQFLSDRAGPRIDAFWGDISSIEIQRQEQLNYPTQKPEALLERIISSSSGEGELICDFFCGSGTAAAVAENMGRKWIVCDLGKFAVHTTRKRMIEVQRQRKVKGKDYRAFEILNLGKYERQHYVGVNEGLRGEEKQRQLAEKEKAFISLILKAYKAEPIEGFRTYHGKKAARMVAVGPINLPVSRLFVDEIVKECVEKQITKVDILAFEFEMGLFPNVQEDAKKKGVDLALKYIPREVFDKRAIEKDQVVFHDVSYIEVKPHVKGNSVAVELTDFSVFYNQDTIKNAEESLRKGGTTLVVQNGQIVKVSKDKSGVMKQEILTKQWTDWIDYWAVDYNFESKQEIGRTKNESGEFDEKWTGDYIFENEWQSFRTKQDRTLELTSAAKEVVPGRYKVAIKVVDIFGNDTMKVIDVNVA